MAAKKDRPTDVNAVIEKAVNAGIQAGHIIATRKATDAYKATEKRLYAYPPLLEKIEADKETLVQLSTEGTPTRSKCVMRYRRSGVRLTPDEIVDTFIQDTLSTIAADEHEAALVAAALDTIARDPYYAAVEGRFIRGYDDDDIAADLDCDPSTVRRNRGRLIRRVAIRLYGASAI
jgi:DNA-directed RNA polymerase specialized sigma24 family protein